MYLPAISMGCAVPGENFAVSVHSVFKSAINLRLHNSDQLLTLLACSESDLPQGIRLQTPEDFSFQILSVGEQASCQYGILRFDSLIVDLRSAIRWQCDLPALRANTARPAVAAALFAVWEALNERQSLLQSEIVAVDLLRWDESTRGDVSARACRSMRGLLHAARRFSMASADPVNTLIGLGPGLTPSGDDMLAGFLAGLWCTVRDRAERVQFIADLGETIIRLSGQTNTISRTYLYHAVHGQVARALANLAEAICQGRDPKILLDIAQIAMHAGHTSGVDAVTGLLAGLLAWDEDPPF